MTRSSATSRGVPVGGGLWRHKLAPPHATFPAVARTGSDDLLRRAGTASVVLVHGPGGFGKTSLLHGLYDRLETSGQRAAWLTLDPSDNDPQRFLVYLRTALGGSLEVGERVDGAAPPAAAASESLLAGLPSGDDEEPLALFLDDLDVITSVEVLGFIRDLIAAMPQAVTLYAGCRRAPDLQLGRLRAQGRVIDVGTDDLRFSHEESGELLAGVLGRTPPPDLVGRLHTRTEGWAAALQLAGLALHRRADPEGVVEGFSGASAGLASYLAEEILSSQPPEIRDLLLASSIADSVCPDLCDALTGRTDSADLLRSIEADNLFVFRLEGTGTWLRFHKLFLEFLHDELTHLHADRVPALHRRAAEWFAANDRPTSAVTHALSSGDHDYAASLADGYAPAFTSEGRLTTIVRWVEPLPRAVLDRYPRLKVHYATALTGTFQHRRAAPLIEEVSTPAIAASLDPETRGILMFAVPFQLVLQDRFEEAHEVCEDHLRRLHSADAVSRVGIMNVRSVCRMHLHRYAEIEATEAEVRTLATGETTYGLVYAECIAGMSELAQGRLHNASAMFDAALDTAIALSSASSAPTAVAAACVAEALYERGELERAGALLSRYLPTITQLGSPDAVLQAHVHHIRTLYRTRGFPDACHAVNELKRLGYERDLARVVATAWAEHSRLALLEEDLLSAERYLERAEADGPYITLWDDTSVTLRARLLVARDRGAEAVGLLDAERRRVGEDGPRRYEVKVRTLLALALKSAGRRREALRALDECLRDVGHDPFLRLFADEGPRLGRLLAELLATHGSAHAVLARRLLAAIEADAGTGSPAEAPTEPLTPRELELLGLVAEGLSNQAIAERLYLSLPTVKSHVRSLLRKLDAKNRTEAVATARRLHLLAH